MRVQPSVSTTPILNNVVFEKTTPKMDRFHLSLELVEEKKKTAVKPEHTSSFSDRLSEQSP